MTALSPLPREFTLPDPRPDTLPQVPRALPHLPVSVPTALTCKCCGGTSTLAGFVDFARDVYHYNRNRQIVSGIAVPYYRCNDCDFGFTDRFDDWSDADFREFVYNDEYHLYDPRYHSARPHKTTSIVTSIFRDADIAILDFGGGNGLTAQLLRDAGYRLVENYDPHHENPVKPDHHDFDLVLCVEVAEHSTRPLELFDELHAYCQPRGVILFSTKDFSSVNGYWLDDGYVAPRNGHVSLFSQRTFARIAERLGRRYLKVDNYRHLLLPTIATP